MEQFKTRDIALTPTNANHMIVLLVWEITGSCSTLPVGVISGQTRNGKALVHCRNKVRL